MATSKGSLSELRTEFATKEGSYKNVKASEHCRPSRQPLFGKELSPVQVSIASCKDKDGLCEWIVFNSGKELYFYPFEGVGQVRPTVRKYIYARVNEMEESNKYFYRNAMCGVWHCLATILYDVQYTIGCIFFDVSSQMICGKY